MTAIAADIDALLAARERIAGRSTADILAVLDRVVERWLAPDSPERRSAEAALAEQTGFAPAMLRAGLPRLLGPLRGESIARLLDEELGRSPTATPRLIVHVLPGNVPALAATAICLSLAVKAAALVKPGRDERCFASLFAASIAALDADLGACIAVRYWPGGAREIEDVVCARADVVDAAGGDAAIDDLRPRVRGRFIGRGGRLSFAALAHEVVADPPALAAAALALAEDVSIWDQRGCLSPQVVFAETRDRAELEVVAKALAAGLDELARRWPPRLLSLDEKTAVLRFRQAAEWGLDDSAPARLFAGDNLCWTIAVEERAALRPTCLARTLRLQPVADLAELNRVLAPARARLEGAGVAAGADRFAALLCSLRAAGAHRVCRVGEMQSPDLSWKPGGIARVAAWFGGAETR